MTIYRTMLPQNARFHSSYCTRFSSWIGVSKASWLLVDVALQRGGRRANVTHRSGMGHQVTKGHLLSGLPNAKSQRFNYAIS